MFVAKFFTQSKSGWVCDLTSTPKNLNWYWFGPDIRYFVRENLCRLKLLLFVSILGSYAKKQNGESQAQTKIFLNFLCVLFKSSSHTGLDYVKKSATNIS
jgi:hypothetical protein